jgi:hypothetical protein
LSKLNSDNKSLESYADKEIRRSELVTKGWGSKKIHEKLITTLSDNAYHLSQVKTWLQRFKNGDLSCKDYSLPGRPVLPLGSQLEAFLFYRRVANSISYISSTTFFRIEKRANLNFRRQKPESTVWVDMDNSMYHNGSKLESKFEQHHIFRLPYPPYSLEISPCDFGSLVC